MELLTAVLSVAATVFVAALGYRQWNRGERRQAGDAAERRELEAAERRRAARAPYDERRLTALRELVDMLRELEIQSRWNAGGRDLRAEVPRVNTFLIRHGEVLDAEEHRLARAFLDGLTWIDRHEAEDRRGWEEERERQLTEHGHDIGSYESSWVTTRPLDWAQDAHGAVRQWTSAREALEERLRAALLGR